MAGSSKKPGIKDLSDLKARLGLNKDAGGGEAAAEPAAPEPEAPAAPAAAAPAPAATPAAAPPAGNPFAAPPAGNPFAPPPAAAPAGVPAGVPTGAPAAAPPEPEDDDEDDDEDDWEEEEEESYDYVAPDVDLSKVEPMGIGIPDGAGGSSSKSLALYGGIGLVIAVATFIGGMVWESSAHESTVADNKVRVATDALEAVQPVVEAWDTFYSEAKSMSPEWSGAQYEKFRKLNSKSKVKEGKSYKWQLDPSVVSDDIFLLGGEPHPLTAINNYIAISNNLAGLLSFHINATKQDLKKIASLAGEKIDPKEDAGSDDDKYNPELDRSEYLGVLFDVVAFGALVKSGSPVSADGKPIFGVTGEIIDVRRIGDPEDPKFVEKYTEELRPAAEARFLQIFNPDMKGSSPIEKGKAAIGKAYNKRKAAYEKSRPKAKEGEPPPPYVMDTTFYRANVAGEWRYVPSYEILLVPRAKFAVPSAKDALARYKDRVDRLQKLMTELDAAKGPLLEALKAHQ